MSVSTGVGRGHGRHHHGPLGPRAKKPTVAGMAKPVSPPKPKGVGRGHGRHHHGPRAKKVKQYEMVDNAMAYFSCELDAFSTFARRAQGNY